MKENRVAGFRPFELERFFAKHEFNARYNLAASDCETLSLQELLQLANPRSLRLWENLSLGYTRAEGLPELREAIAGDYLSGDADDVLTVVPVEGIYLTLRALIEAGDEVIAPWPAYQSLYEVASASGAHMRYWKPDLSLPVTDDSYFSIESLEALITEKTKLIILNFPHNPTGAQLTQDAWKSVFEKAERVGAWVLSDEMYRGLERQPEGTQLPAAYEMGYQRAISLSGLSKRHGLPGLRMGWLATKARSLMSRLMQLKDYTTICSPAPAEVLGLIGMEAQSDLTARSRGFIEAGFDACEALMAAHPGAFEWTRPAAGPISFVKLQRSTGFVNAFMEQLLKVSGVLILPGGVYDKAYEDYFRIGVGRASAPDAIRIVGEALEGIAFPSP